MAVGITVGVEVKFKPVEVVEKTADDRGRITLGSEYANKDVKLLVIE